MSEEDDLARRFLALWAEYLAALVADPKMSEPLRRWLAIAAVSLGDAGVPPGSAADAATATGASGERDAAVAELARRVDELHERVATLERSRKPAAGARRRNPRARP